MVYSRQAVSCSWQLTHKELTGVQAACWGHEGLVDVCEPTKRQGERLRSGCRGC